MMKRELASWGEGWKFQVGLAFVRLAVLHWLPVAGKHSREMSVGKTN